MSFATLQTPFSPGKKTVEGFTLPSVLPHDVAALKTLLVTQQTCFDAAVAAIRKEAHDYVIRMLEQAILARQRMFGTSSEQLSAQSRLFDEAESLAQTSLQAQDTAPQAPQEPADVSEPSASPSVKVGRGKRVALATGLPRVDVVHDVPADQRTCPCGTPMVEIGQDISEQLDIVPMQVRVLRHIRKRYGCPTGQRAPVTAKLPAQPLPKSNASVDFLAMLLAVKFVDGQPLARFENVLARHHAVVPRQTLARWVIGCAGVLQPLHNLMRDVLLDGALIHMDETVVQVLKEKDKAPTSNSYMWVQTGGPPDKPVVLYDYDRSRSASVPTALLEGFKGYLMTDGYDGYNAVARIDGIERLACWAHVRRRFVDATRVQPKGKRGRADEAVSLIGKLYGVEREHKDAAPEVRHLARQQRSVPVLAELRAWMLQNTPLVTPKSALGTALAYMGNLWAQLTRYTERGDLPIDNNRCENAIRPFVIGRKAWLFSDTPAGAHASAVIYSLVQTAKANGLEPYTWLRRVLRDLPAAKTVEEVEALLPWNLRLTDLVGNPAQ
jgi:transposase